MHPTIRVGEMSVTFIKTRHETAGAFDLFELTIPPSVESPCPTSIANTTKPSSASTAPWSGLSMTNPLRSAVASALLFRAERRISTRTAATPARILCLQTPGIMGPEYYFEIAAHFHSDGPNVAGVATVMSRYGVVPVAQDE